MTTWIELLGCESRTLWMQRFGATYAVTEGDQPPWEGKKLPYGEGMAAVRGDQGGFCWTGWRTLEEA